MSERPNLIFGAFLALAGAAAAVLLIGLAEAGAGGAAGFAAVSAGLVSACIRFAIELRELPPALVLVSVTAVASGVALLRALCSIWREQRSIRALPVIPLAESDYRDALLVPRGAEVGVLRSRRQGAFCAGLLRPRVVMTSALLDALDPDERRAVVEHELSHARGGAPLKLMLGHVAVRTLFWVPLLRDLADRYVLLTELEADRDAIAATSPSALAGALSEALEAPAIVGSAGLADHAAARIDRLFDARAKLPQLITPARAALTLLRRGHGRRGGLLVAAPEQQPERATARHVGQLARTPSAGPSPRTRHHRPGDHTPRRRGTRIPRPPSPSPGGCGHPARLAVAAPAPPLPVFGYPLLL